ncbi:MAG: DUF456 family protein [Bacillus sp. (in: Bacteria)]|nr:DUF456 family protein [Bacillus sp. (in: firmicutes)]
MEIIYWGLIVICFLLAFVGLIYPIIPGMLFLFGGYLLYGLFFSFEPFHWSFWVIQLILACLMMGADYVINGLTMNRRGASKAGFWGSTIGIIIGPLIIPVFGIIIGPFVGAVVGEIAFGKKPIKESLSIGIGSLISFFSSTFVKAVIQLGMIVYFFLVI